MIDLSYLVAAARASATVRCITAVLHPSCFHHVPDGTTYIMRRLCLCIMYVIQGQSLQSTVQDKAQTELTRPRNAKEMLRLLTECSNHWSWSVLLTSAWSVVYLTQLHRTTQSTHVSKFACKVKDNCTAYKPQGNLQ